MQTKIAFLPSLKQSVSSIPFPCTLRTFGIVKHYFACKDLAIIEHDASLLLIDCSLIPQFYFEPLTMYYFYGKLDTVKSDLIQQLDESFRACCTANGLVLQVYFYKSVLEMEQLGVNKVDASSSFPLMKYYQQIMEQK